MNNPLPNLLMRILSILVVASLTISIATPVNAEGNRKKSSSSSVKKITETYDVAIATATQEKYKKSATMDKLLTKGEFLKVAVCDYSNLFCSTQFRCTNADTVAALKSLKNANMSGAWAPYFCEAKLKKLLDEDFIKNFNPNEQIPFSDVAKIFTNKLLSYQGKDDFAKATKIEALNELSKREAIPMAIEKIEKGVTEAQAIEILYRTHFRVYNKPHREYNEKASTLVAVESKEEIYLPNKQFDTILGNGSARFSIILSTPLKEKDRSTSHTYLMILKEIQGHNSNVNFIFRPSALISSCEPNCTNKDEEKRNRDGAIIARCLETDQSIMKLFFLSAYQSAVFEKKPFTNQDILKGIVNDPKTFEISCLKNYSHFPIDRELAKVSECVFNQKKNVGYLAFIDQFLKNDDPIDFWEEAAKNAGADNNLVKSCLNSNKFPRTQQNEKITKEFGGRYSLLIDNVTKTTYISLSPYDYPDILKAHGF